MLVLEYLEKKGDRQHGTIVFICYGKHILYLRTYVYKPCLSCYRSSDFAFASFQMLKKILLVHGHWYYQRLATLIQYSFYKNLAFVNLMVCI